ncbi:MAG: pyridoxamine 5'-phosphate oxidase family protein [Eubacteriales bacterium]|nr:pyridoxamine 5'-phosphate oxidase family protein [Eubacteriales bacterium]
MEHVERFYQAVKNEMAATLATSADGVVTMRLISPVEYDGAVLLFTDASSNKYAQLKQNPRCCLSVGGFFLQAEAEFFGPTMLDKNAAMREVYDAKFPGAFAEGIAFGGRNAEFILLRPIKLSGWAFLDDIPTADGIPNLPFEITMDTRN